ncbi:MAG: response regulator [Nitrospinota bacterium]|nr:response regulator [Nitrospinota bacterium]
MPVKVLVVDDSMMMRRLVKDIVSSSPDIEVVGDANNGKVALEKTEALSPDVVLLDIEMPVMTGLEYLQAIKGKNLAKVIVLSSLTQEDSETAKEVIELGAHGVIAKPSGAVSLDLHQRRGHEIVKAIEKAAAS